MPKSDDEITKKSIQTREPHKGSAASGEAAIENKTLRYKITMLR